MLIHRLLVCNTRWDSPYANYQGRYLIEIDCLGKNGFNQAKCEHLIDALYECCDAFYKKTGETATTASCPKPSLLRLKLKQRQEGNK